MPVNVRRAGKQIDTCAITVENVGEYVDLNRDVHRLRLRFNEPRTYGPLRYAIDIEADSFRTLALAMVQADREAAISAFGAALQAEPVKIEREKNWLPPDAA